MRLAGLELSQDNGTLLHVPGLQLAELALYLGTMVAKVVQFFVEVIDGLSCRPELDVVIGEFFSQWFGLCAVCAEKLVLLQF